MRGFDLNIFYLILHEKGLGRAQAVLFGVWPGGSGIHGGTSSIFSTITVFH